MQTTTINVYGVDLELHYKTLEAEPFESETGYLGRDEYKEIYHIFLNGTDVTSLLEDKAEEIEKKLNGDI